MFLGFYGPSGTSVYVFRSSVVMGVGRIRPVVGQDLLQYADPSRPEILTQPAGRTKTHLDPPQLLIFRFFYIPIRSMKEGRKKKGRKRSAENKSLS